MGLADFYTNAAGQTASSAAAPAAQLALPAPVAETGGFLSRALPTLRNAMGGVTALGAGTGIALTNAVENGLNGGGYYNNTIADQYAPGLAQEYADHGFSPRFIGTGIRAVGHTALGGLADAILPSRNSGVGAFLSGLTGIDGTSSTTPPKTNLAGQAAPTGGTPPTEAVDKRPVLKLSELPALNLAQLKMLQPFLPKQPGPQDNLKGAYYNIINDQHEAAIREANKDPAKIREANKNLIKGMTVLVGPGSASAAYIMPPTSDE